MGRDRTDAYTAQLREALDSLVRFPHLGMSRSSATDDVRALVVGQHRVYYRVEPDAVVVLRILHARFDSERLQF